MEKPENMAVVVNKKTLKNRKKRLKRKLKAKMMNESSNKSQVLNGGDADPREGLKITETNPMGSKGTNKRRRLKQNDKKRKMLKKNCDDGNEENIFDYYGDGGDRRNDSPIECEEAIEAIPVIDAESGNDVVSSIPNSKEKGLQSRSKSNPKNSKFWNQLKGGAPADDGDSNSSEDILMAQCELPVYKVRENLIRKLSKRDCLIIKGDTGSGKTTQIPQYIIDKGLAGKEGVIAVTQPRRVAAISIAERVAKERCCTIGEEVGYCVRFDDMSSPDTRIKYVTDGMLLRESIFDPLLMKYRWVILDEAHERTIHTDVLFGIVKAAQKTRKNENMRPLKVIVMSATLEEEKMSQYFDDADIFSVPGRQNPITRFFAKEDDDDYVSRALRTVIQIHRNEEEGDILVFLTGEEEIDYAYSELSKALVCELEAVGILRLQPHVLYAALPSCQQLKVLKRPPPGTRKVIFSTNIAETSITIPNIKFVVDSGMVKCRTYSAVGGLDMLKVERISKAQAEQRAGRAGRETAGTCYRIYTAELFESLKDFPVPEIKRCSLASVILQIVAIGITNIVEFDFMDKPSNENISAAVEQLKLLGAVEGEENELKLTEIGKTISHFPLDPRFSKIIISSQKYKCVDEVLSIISLLSVDAIFLSVSNQRTLYKTVRHKFNSCKGDHVTLLNVYKAAKSVKFSREWCLAHKINHRNMRRAYDIRQQLSQICQYVGISPCSCGQDTERIRKSFLTGLFMNTAILTTNKVYKKLGCNHKVRIHPSSVLFHERPFCVIYTDLVETSRCYMRNLSAVDVEWLTEVSPEYFRSRSLIIAQSS